MKTYSIRRKLIAFMLAVTIIPLTLSLVITLVYTKESIKEQSMGENARLIFQGKTNLVNYLNNINRASTVLYSDSHFLNNLSKSFDDYQAVAEMYITLQNLQGSLPDIQQVYLHSYLTNQSTLITNTVPRREFRESPYLGTEKADPVKPSTEPPHYAHSYGFPPSLHDDPKQLVFTYYRPIVRIPSTDRMAMLAIDLKLDGIAAISEQLFHPDDEKLYLLDENGIIIYSGQADGIGKPLDDPGLFERMRSGGQGIIDEEGAIRVYEKLGLAFADWTIVKEIPYNVLYRKSNELITINAVIAAVALIVVIAGTLYISIRITRPILRLASYMNQIQTGKLDVDIDVRSRDEIGFLTRRFKQMMDTINNLILRKYKLELANKSNQLEALQAQIDPHFLFNTLQSIGTVALQHDAPRVYSLLSSLADIMRYKMRSGEAMVTLEEELDQLKLYMELQKERFDEQFDFFLEIDPASLSAPMPKMTLQPLAENYFKHGMNDQSGTGNLTVRSRITDDDRVIVEIENNGSSIPLDRLRQLQEALEINADEEHNDRGPETEISSSIGLQNVLMRLKLYTDDTAGLEIANMQPQGVSIRLNYRRGA
ncbi:sensor histidine kinase [Paenibacillus pinisoli]|uniref:Sensor histidine kinase n=2 Tax=Paenibacillus pinisoli TaxID=1276110 RepID=A0A3A6PMD8_9BACL|nr:sensor histidine kinase [Paenibacillus pinisoli]